ncbi:TPA: hypothetical protein ACH3X1_012977 [Trebouxia sp. C0004]
MNAFEDAEEKDAKSRDATPPPLNEAIFEDPALTLSEIQQAFDRACRSRSQSGPSESAKPSTKQKN